MCALAETLSTVGSYHVTLLVDRTFITRDELQRRFHLDLERVQFKECSAGTVQSLLSTADIGVVLSNFKPFGNHARKNVYMLQIPYPEIAFASIVGKALRGEFKESAKDVLRRKLFADARGADLVLINSTFVQTFLKRYHGIEGSILYPPIDDFFIEMPKEHIILSVGRFFRGLYNDKRYDVLIEAFKKLRARLPHTSWTYHLVGSCGDDAKSLAYLDELRVAATGHPIYFHVNASFDDLRRYYNQAEVFWHAAGFGVDEERFPERTEHFGMSTVEAMSAGAVPVVINKGGQKEIVSHGKSGYLWNTLDELLENTSVLIDNPDMRHIMQQEARARFNDFDRKHFSSRLISLFKELDPD
jgi:glycosyltransferase involved in cell wall biosynthesis